MIALGLDKPSLVARRVRSAADGCPACRAAGRADVRTGDRTHAVGKDDCRDGTDEGKYWFHMVWEWQSINPSSRLINCF